MHSLTYLPPLPVPTEVLQVYPPLYPPLARYRKKIILNPKAKFIEVQQATFFEIADSKI